mmetsp:Transcript_882/g.2350  ORF Transcript_882/g.2350 Transcript_882/m.2350 type:complete len:214 (+) Transcript_882:726-1367(+)
MALSLNGARLGLDVHFERRWVHCHTLGRIVCLVDANEPVRELKHIVPQRNDDKLRIFSHCFAIVGHDRHVLEVQGGVDFVHKVERCRPEFMQREHQCQRAQSFFASAQIGDVLPALFRRPDREYHTFRKWVQRIDELELCIATLSDELVQGLELLGNLFESIIEFITPLFDKGIVLYSCGVPLFGLRLQLGEPPRKFFLLQNEVIDGLQIRIH